MVSEQTELIRVFFLLPIAEAHKNESLKVKHGFLNSDPRFHNQFMISTNTF